MSQPSRPRELERQVEDLRSALMSLQRHLAAQQRAPPRAPPPQRDAEEHLRAYA